MEKTTWNAVDPALRGELESLLGSPTDAFESDYQDTIVWFLILLSFCVVGAVAALYNFTTSEMEFGFFGEYFREDPLNALYAIALAPTIWGFPVAVVVGAWSATKMVRYYGKCGIALTSSALVLIRGPKLLVVRYSDVESSSQNVIRTKKQTFTVLTVKTKDGRTKDFYCHGRFAALARQRLPEAASAAAA